MSTPDADPLDIVAAEFVAGAGPGASPPPPTTVEVAFAGRSNVGKSSLINALVGRKALVRTSSTPGSTRQINFYMARARDGRVWHLVDLPGYGFTRRSKAETASWRALVENYLRARPTLAAVVLLVDARRGLEDDDRELIEFIDSAAGRDGPRTAGLGPVEVVLVATKTDKLPRSSRRATLDRIGRQAGRKVIGTSAESGEGTRDVWRHVRRLSGVA